MTKYYINRDKDGIETLVTLTDGRKVFLPNDNPEYLQWTSEGNTTDIEEPVTDSQVEQYVLKRSILENEYLEATKQLCILAGDTIEDSTYPKLNNSEYNEKSKLAIIKNSNEAFLIISTMSYKLLSLNIEYNWKWEQIEHRNNI